MRKRILLVFLVAFAAFVLAACKTVYKVTFDSNGGSAVQVAEVEKGKKVAKPTDPTKEGFDFEGWFLNDDKFDFDTTIEKDITLKASWKEKEVDVVVIEFTVTFNSDGGSNVPSKKVEEGKAVSKPTNPTKEGFEFKEWQLDGVKYDFTTVVTKDITLKAIWEEVSTERPIVGDPKIVGATRTVEITVGDDYIPLEGITAFDKYGDEVTGDLETDFDPTWLTKKGNYRFKIWVDIDEERVSFNVIFTVLGAESEDIEMEYPEVVTHYIGSTFDPVQEVFARDIKTDEIVEVEADNFDEYFILSPGTYHYDVVAYDSKGKEARRTIKLTTKPAVDIPNTLSKTETITIEMWHSNGSAIETALKRYATEFEAMMLAQGYKVKVNMEKPASTYDELRTTVVNALKGAKLPHLVQNYPDHVVEYNSYGAIASLMPYINHPVWGMNPEIEKESFTDILEAYRREQRAVSLDGDYLSLPFNKSTEVVAYNKDMFDYVLEGKPFPETWQELFALGPDLIAASGRFIDDIAAKWAQAGSPLTAAEIQKVKDQFIPFAYDSKANAFITLSRQFGGAYTGRTETGNGTLLFDSAQVRNMLTYFGENNDLFTIPEVWDTRYASDMIKQGYTAMAIGSTGGIRYNTPYEKGTKLFNLGVAPMFYDENYPNRKAVIQQGTNISLTSEGTAEEKLVAWLFLKYLTSNEVQEDFGILTGYSPVRNSVYSNQGFLDYLANADEEIKANNSAHGLTQAQFQQLFELKVKAMAFQAVKDDRKNLFYDTPFVGSSAARNAVGVAFERVILRTGNLAETIEDAIDYALDEAGKILRD